MINREFYALLLAMLWERKRYINKDNDKNKDKNRNIERKKEKNRDKESYINPFWSIYIYHLVFFAKN